MKITEIQVDNGVVFLQASGLVFANTESTEAADLPLDNEIRLLFDELQELITAIGLAAIREAKE